MKYSMSAYGPVKTEEVCGYGVFPGDLKDAPQGFDSAIQKFTAVFPCEGGVERQAQAKEHAMKFCAYLNEREEFIAKATQALSVAARMGSTNP